MRFPIAALFFIILLFVAFCGYAVSSFMLGTMQDELITASDTLTANSKTMFLNEMNLIQLGFGVAMVMFFILIIVVFVVDALRQEPETYYPPPGY